MDSFTKNFSSASTVVVTLPARSIGNLFQEGLQILSRLGKGEGGDFHSEQLLTFSCKTRGFLPVVSR